MRKSLPSSTRTRQPIRPRYREAVVTQALKACARIGDVQRGSRIYKAVASRIEGDPYTMTSLIQLLSEFNL